MKNVLTLLVSGLLSRILHGHLRRLGLPSIVIKYLIKSKVKYIYSPFGIIKLLSFLILIPKHVSLLHKL